MRLILKNVDRIDQYLITAKTIYGKIEPFSYFSWYTPFDSMIMGKYHNIIYIFLVLDAISVSGKYVMVNAGKSKSKSKSKKILFIVGTL